jgi:RNA polymerase sigma factor (sigma-70 family)
MKPPPDLQAAVPILIGERGSQRARSTTSRGVSLPRPALRLLSDERLARLASSGDRDAFGAIFHRYHQELHRYCVTILGNADDAGDALQSTMLRALNALEGEAREIALRPWLHRIAHNESITLLRRPRDAEAGASMTVPARLGGEESVELRAQLRQLLGDLRELPERQRGALVMRELGGLSYSEIADVFETTSAGAKQATYDARRALHELAKGREMDCAVVCTALSDNDGRALRGRALRAHLRACRDCRDFRSAITDRQAELAALTPVIPSAAATGLLESVLASAGGSAGGGGLIAGLAVPAALKSCTTVAVVAALGAGVLEVVHPGSGERGSDRETRAALTPRSGRPALPVPTARRAPGSHRAHRGHAGSSRPGRARATADRPRADDRPPSRDSVHAPPAPAQAPPRVTSGAELSAPSARSRRRGPIRQVVPRDSHPVREGVRGITHADLPEIRAALPVKLPPLPIHPKRKRVG